MTKVAIVYHSGFGHTKAVAESVRKGAAGVSGTEAVLISVDELPDAGEDRSLGGRWGELNDADAIIFGCPTYMGSVTAALKRVFEVSSSIWFGQGWKDKLAAGFTNSGSFSGDKVNTLQDIQTYASQQSMMWVPLACMPTGNGPEDMNRLGGWVGLITQADNASAEETPPAGDHKTAEHLGTRVAEAAARWAKGAG